MEAAARAETDAAWTATVVEALESGEVLAERPIQATGPVLPNWKESPIEVSLPIF